MDIGAGLGAGRAVGEVEGQFTTSPGQVCVDFAVGQGSVSRCGSCLDARLFGPPIVLTAIQQCSDV